MWKQITEVHEIEPLDEITLLSPCNPEDGGGEPIYSIAEKIDNHIVLDLVATRADENFDEAEETKNKKSFK